MKKYIFLLCAIYFACTSLLSLGQIKYAFEIETNKKKINLDQFDIPQDYPIIEVLNLIPELLNRDIDKILNDYDIQLEEMSIFNARMSFLRQTKVRDVELIEIKDSPTASEQKNRQGGIINIVLKKNENGFNGNVDFELTSKFQTMPSANIKYKNDKLFFEGWLHTNLEKPFNYGDDKYRYIDFERPLESYEYSRSNSSIETYETMSFYLRYNPNPHHVLTARLYGGYEFNKMCRNYDIQLPDTTTKNQFDYSGTVIYDYRFVKDHQIEVEFDYARNPKDMKFYDDFSYYDQNLNTSSFTGKIEYQVPFVKTDDNKKFLFKVGYGANFKSEDNSYTNLSQHYRSTLKPEYHSSIMYPYTEIDMKFGRLTLKTSMQYKMHDFKLDVENKRVKQTNISKNCVTGNFIIGYQLHKHHFLQFYYDHSVRTPEYIQLLPYRVYNPEKDHFNLGNIDLKPISTNMFSLRYITDNTIGKNSFVANVGFNYYYVNQRITSVYTQLFILGPPSRTQESYENKGTSNIMCVNAMFSYSRGIFSGTLLGNFFNNSTSEKDVKSTYNYYNLGCCLAFHLPKDWMLTFNYKYHSDVKSENSIQSDFHRGEIRADKHIGKWNFYFALVNFLNAETTDIQIGDTYESYLTTNPYPFNVSVGFSFRFFNK